MNAEKHVLMGRWTAIISFLSGTILFASYFITSESKLIFIGSIFIVIVGSINLAVLIAISIKLSKEEQRKKLFKICIFMLFNIPVMLVYCWFAVVLLNTMRITFTNSTSAELSDIRITGCEERSIANLQSGESKTIWIDITHDCRVDIEYVINGKPKKENVEEYLCIVMGSWSNYMIGAKENKPH